MATQMAELTTMDAVSTRPATSAIIKVEDLWKTYDMGSEQQVHALRGVNIDIKRNEYVAIMGPSGSGKSTLMNLIGCLDSPSKGNYWLNGHLVSELDDDEVEIIRGALQLSEKRVRDIMTPMRSTYWLSPDEEIDASKIDEIKARGWSRWDSRQCPNLFVQ